MWLLMWLPMCYYVVAVGFWVVARLLLYVARIASRVLYPVAKVFLVVARVVLRCSEWFLTLNISLKGAIR